MKVYNNSIMIKSYKLMIIFCIFAVRCTTTHQGIQDRLESAKLIHGRVISEPVEIYSEPLRMIYNSPFLIFSVNKGDKLVTVFNTESQVISNQIGSKGMGPNELMMVGNIQNSPDNSNIFIFDIIRKSIYSIDRDQITNTEIELLEQVSVGSQAQQAFFIKKNTHLINGPIPTGRFIMFKNGEIASNFKKFPNFPTDVKDTVHLNMGYNNYSAFRPDGRGFANIIFSTEIIECFSIRNDAIEQKWSHEWSMKPFRVYQVGPASGIENSDAAFGFKNLCVNNQHIFCTYSDIPMRESNGFSAHGHYLIQFDWDGNIDNIYKLDYPLRTIAVSEDGSKLFGTTKINHDVKIVEYNLN
jgi:hypothetical protein